MKLPIAIAGSLIGAVIGIVGLLLYPFAGLLSPLLGVVIGGCAGGVARIFTLKHSITGYQRDVRPGLATYRLTAYFGVLAAIISGGVLGLIITFWGLAILYGRGNNIQLLAGIAFGAILCGFPAAIYVRCYIKELKKIQYEKYLASVPENAGDFIKSIIGKMRYREKIRYDVMAELVAHFEDELRDCKTDEEKGKKSQQLIEQFGDAKLLGILLRRAKKRCRPLWRTAIVRTFQTVGVLILVFIVYCVYISLGKPTINVNYVEEATRLVRPVADESLNAAPIYQKAFGAYKEPPQIKLETAETSLADAVRGKDWITELTEEELVLMKQWLSDNTEAIEFFRQAVEKPYCWWELGAKDNFVLNILMPELNNIKNLVKTTVWQAKLNAYNRHTKEAFDDLLVCYRAGRHFKGTRTLVEQLVGMAIQGISIKSVFVILDNQDVDSQILKDLQVRLEEFMAEDTYIINYKVERFCGLDFLQRCYTDNGRGSGHMIPGRALELMSSIDGSYKSNDETWEKLEFGFYLAVSIASANRRDMSRVLDKAYNICEERTTKTPWQMHEENVNFDVDFYNWSTLKQKRYWLVSLLMPALDTINRIAYRHKTNVDALITTLAITRFKQSVGNHPESMDDLVAAGYLKSLPMDPWSDKPLVYKRTDDGFMLYGIGSNFKDDGGEVARDDKGKVKKYADEGDWVFWPVQK